MTLLDFLPGEYKRSGNKNGGEYGGACPWCGDGGKGRDSDRFRIWPEQGRGGSYWCRMCGKKGNAITYLMEHDGLQFKEAVARLNLTVEEVLGSQKRDRLPVGYQPRAAAPTADLWAEHALKFVDWCHERLLERPKELGWLFSRGIGEEMVKKYRLGWNPDHAWREGDKWGLAMEKKADGKLKKLWLPRGMVIPMIAADGRVLRLRIRQPDQLPRYLVITGSSREPLCSRAADAMFVVESELDAILLDALVGDLIGVVAMGNDTAKPTAQLMPIIRDALFIGVSLDSDLPRYNPDTGNMDMPGAKASRWWLGQFPQAMRVPVVGGKDPGDAYSEGIDLRTWVMSSLPPYFHVKAELEAEKKRRGEALKVAAVPVEPVQPEQQDMPPAAETDPPVDVPSSQAVLEPAAGTDGDQAAEPPPVKTVTLKNGRSFCLASDQVEWQRLADSGAIVFSEWELKRLQTACSGMAPEERSAAAKLVLDVKEIFGPAWIRRGEALVVTE